MTATSVMVQCACSTFQVSGGAQLPSAHPSHPCRVSLPASLDGLNAQGIAGKRAVEHFYARQPVTQGEQCLPLSLEVLRREFTLSPVHHLTRHVEHEQKVRW